MFLVTVVDVYDKSLEVTELNFITVKHQNLEVVR